MNTRDYTTEMTAKEGARPEESGHGADKGNLARWVVASAVGLAAGEAAFGVTSEMLGHGGLLGPEGSIGDGAGHIIGLFVGGALFGLVQWLFLRAYAHRAGWISLGSGLGLTAGFLLGFVLFGGFPFDFMGGFLGLGLGVGISQWLVLRRGATKTAQMVPASALGYLLGGIAGLAVVFPLGDAINAGVTAALVPILGHSLGDALAFASIVGIAGAIAGAVGGLVSGVLLSRILGQISE
jgi:hypothetical protein